MRKYFLFLVGLLCLLAPAMATGISGTYPTGYNEYVTSPLLPIQYIPYYYESNLQSSSYSFYTTHDYGITAVKFQINEGSGDFSVLTYDGDYHNGSWSYTNTGFLTYNLSLTFNGATQYANTVDPVGSEYIHIGTAINATTNKTVIVVWKYLGGFDYLTFEDEQQLTFAPIAGIAWNTISGSIDTVDIEYYKADIAAGAGQTGVGAIIDFFWNVIAFFGTAITLIIAILFWFKFIFIDNFLLLIGLFELATIALAINSSSNAFKAIAKWWRYQTKLIDFFIDIIHKIVDIVYLIKNTIPFLRWL